MRVEAVSDGELDELADTEHPQGVVAVVEPRRWALEDIAAAPGSPVLVLDGGAGSGQRRHDAPLRARARRRRRRRAQGNGGAHQSEGGARQHGRALPAAGRRRATRRRYLAWAGERGIETWVAAADGDADRAGRGARRIGRPLGLVLGNEGAGVSPALDAAASRRVAIPLAPGVESLNVAVAAGILLREVARVD